MDSLSMFCLDLIEAQLSQKVQARASDALDALRGFLSQVTDSAEF